ncbi:MAG: hypothetical protein MMC33_008231 [Icmadophila ericetorum]|nr:hypothetical protein [Icmadophila ericetorum]
MSKVPQAKAAIVIGAGVGGVATAARLAKAGFNVTVFEKNDFTGGRCSLIHHEGYRFDQGPSLLLLPDLFREAFYDLDTSLEAEGVELYKCEPNYNLWFSDGESFELSTDTAKMKREIEKWEGKDGFDRYLSFLQESHRHYELSVTEVLKKNFTSLLDMTRLSFVREVFALHPFESIYSRAARYFWTERLRRVFTFGSMYMGMSPFDAPGTYSLLQYTELAEGIWYPKGGFHAIVAALVHIGQRLGVKYRLSTPVSQINISPTTGRATGITLQTGESVSADIVIVNADLVYAYNNLFPQSRTSSSKSTSTYAKSLSKRDASCSSISFYWSLDRKIPELTTHNIFLADAYQASFDDIFKRHLIPAEPSFYVNVPSRIDPTAAPEGCDSIVVLVPVGHLIEDAEGKGNSPSPSTQKSAQDWSHMVSTARNTVLSTISTRTGCTPLDSHIIHESVNTPLTWKSAFNLDRGAILGLSHSFFNVLAFRPRTRHVAYKSCYFVGASTHPGTGVPICLAGSKITSEQILGDLGMSVPWKKAAAKAQTSELDSVQRGLLPEWLDLRAFVYLLLAFVVYIAWSTIGAR